MFDISIPDVDSIATEKSYVDLDLPKKNAVFFVTKAQKSRNKICW